MSGIRRCVQPAIGSVSWGGWEHAAGERLGAARRDFGSVLAKPMAPDSDTSTPVSGEVQMNT